MQDRRPQIALFAVLVFGAGFALGYAVRGERRGRDEQRGSGPSTAADVLSTSPPAGSGSDAQVLERGDGASGARAIEGSGTPSGAQGDVAVIGGGGGSGGAARGGGGEPGGGGAAPAPGVADGGRPRGRLDAAAIREEVRSHRDELGFCFAWQLNQHPELEGRITMGFTIDAQGRVSEAEVLGDELGDPTVLRCFVSVTRRMQFPAPDGGEVTVHYPFELSPRDDAAGDRDRRDGAVARERPR